MLTTPRIATHCALRDVEVARTIVQVTRQQPSTYPGSRALITE